MPRIKTKDTIKGTIKTINKAAIAAEKIKEVCAETKNKADTGMYAQNDSENEYAADYMQEGERRIVQGGIDALEYAGEKSIKRVRENTLKIKDRIKTVQQKRMAKKIIHPSENPLKKQIKTKHRTEETIKQSAQATRKNIKTSEQAAKVAIKTSEQAAKETAKAAAKSAKMAAKAAQQAAKAMVKGAIAVVKAIAAAIKGIMSGIHALIAAVAGSGTAVLVIVVLCMVALLICSAFGIFFSAESPGVENSMTLQMAVQEINADYNTKIQEIRDSSIYDSLEMSGSRAVWKEVLAVYAVKTSTDSVNPQDVVTMNENKKMLLFDIFWEMNEITHKTETKTETVIEETDDGHGNIVQTEKEVTSTVLYITVSHKTADEMSAKYGFNEEQKAFLAELLCKENDSLWAGVLYGIQSTGDQIVKVALSQVGNVGGDPYWSWYGFGSRVEWCACFVSWCANECGYIDNGIIPKYAGCENGVQWFKDRGQWVDGSAEPVPGMIIFFDWDNKGDSGPQDGLADHTGIVQKVENGRVYTIEGNSDDSCRINSYTIGYYEILGYGNPAY